MMHRPSRILVLVAPVVLATAIGLPHAAATPRTGEFTAELAPLNQAGNGTVTITQQGTNVTVHLRAAGLDGGVHVAHIHGLRQAQNECPTLSFDADGNGLVDLVEGIPAYGPVQVTLSQGSNDRGTSLDYSRTYTHRDSGDAIASLGNLDEYVVVVHGVDLDGDGVATNPDVEQDGAGDHDDHEITMPALCGAVEPAQ
jgi:hypothetical protein